MKQTNNIIRKTLNQGKKLALLVVLFLTVGLSYSFAASGDEVTVDIRTSFQKDFKGAKIINTEVKKAFTRLTFTMNDMVFSAFYADNGELLAVTRNILSTQLPVNLQLNLKNNYSGYWITELFELSGNDQSCYYISLENADSKLTLRSIDGSSWEVYEKSAKN
ncbi:MAG TPA: hypothetical protein VL832_18765 [Puia sp.]|nr:hypothetical protein [Puia sp.]